MTKTTDAKKDHPDSQWFVFGLDDNNKPVGARFPTSEAKVFEIVTARKLDSHPAYNGEWAALGMQLPVGRIYARGKAFIPNIPQALYNKLQTALARCKEEYERSRGERSGAVVTTGESKSGTAKPPTEATIAPVASGFPKTWEEIGPGHVLLAQESLPDGWWEAIVVSRDKDILTLRYRDYPKAPKFTRHIATIAMLNPGSA
jgi:hypothetical protein